ncbi:hypothetical protein EDD85DRAFT_860078 [Armillaria nabsnona]|nr:hypothetical protein EDD85DRAFT_860078 [Armillaria nabsnona]
MASDLEAALEEIEECSHIAAALTDESIISRYKKFVSWNVHQYQVVRSNAKRRKISAPSCGICETLLSRPFVCLHCSFAGCWTHILDHLTDAEHLFCVDPNSGSVFCSDSDCMDMVYNAKLEAIYLATVISAEEKETRYQVSKRSREPFVAWVPSDEDVKTLEGSLPISCQARRGLLNLGQTCFLNVVLQCLVHNPLIRNYFLGDKHNVKGCKIEDCSCCEMDKLFTEIYSVETAPYGPSSFLATTWTKSPELAGYAQHDAHEFFISVLNHIHSNSRGSTNVSCNCIIHSTFAGQLQSDVKCERCNNVTSTSDPMLDISLELKDETTLHGCLKRFTQSEKLGSKEYNCGKCNKSSREVSKRMSISKLPPVLSFQFKRFEHKTSDKPTARKLDTPVRFPATINMAPFTSIALKENEKENNFASFGPEVMYEYDLFAVINHEGQISNGHYTNFARFGSEWYRFDDDKVTHSSLSACLDSRAYMCFYVKRHLDYQPHTRPTYVLTRETEAVREKELEREKEAARLKEADRELDDALLAVI